MVPFNFFGGFVTPFILISPTRPDPIMEPQQNWTIDPTASVNIRMGLDGIAAEKPVTIVECFTKIAQDYPDHPALVSEESLNVWKTISYSNYYSKVVHMAKVFIQLGLEDRHSVGILATNSSEWFITALGAIFAGGLETGIYTTNSPDAVCHILSKSQANVVVVEDKVQLEKIRKIKHKLPQLKAVIILNGSIESGDLGDDYYKWEDLADLQTTDSVEEEFKKRVKNVKANQTAALIFTVRTFYNHIFYYLQ